MQRKTSNQLYVAALVVLAVIWLSSSAHAYPNGVSGFSGKSGSTCKTCHSSGTPLPTVVISGPATVVSASTNSYTLNNSGGPNSGLDVAASAGTFTAGSNTQVMNSEITHKASLTSTPLTWTFNWTAPTVTTTTTVTMYGASISGGYGGSTGSGMLTITVNPPAVAPSITSQPGNQTVTAGQTATFSVSATGTAPLSYLWRKNGANISGATSNSFTTPATTTADSGSTFSVVVTNSAGSATSNNATLTVNAAAVAPSITSQPASQTVTAGQTATFSASATGTAPMSYQWRKNGASITGATSSSYTTPATTTADSGSTFSVVVTNSAGSASSNNATLTVNAAAVAPSITSQPGNQTVTSGQIATFSVSATGTAPLSYQWRENGLYITGATSSSYTTPATTTADSGATFSVVVTNSAGSVTSNNATLTVNTAAVAPSITSQPANQTVTVGQTASFTVSASGTAPLSYQWRKNNANITGATSSAYTTPTTTTADSGSTFSVMVTNSAGSATSNNAILNVNAAAVAPSITTQPANQSVTAGQAATFTVSTTGTAPMSYQWRKNGTSITGATSNSYSTPATSTTDSGSTFSVVISNSAGSATSNNATLTVNQAAAVAPTVTTQPVNQTVAAGQTATFSVLASGTAPLSYQWRKNGTNITGATSSSYTTAATTTADTGSTFSVVVNNSAGSAASNNATLTVNSAPPPSGRGKLVLSTERLVFYVEGNSAPTPKMIKVTSSSGSAMAFNADVYGGSWISINPSAGTTPGQLTVSAYPTGLTAGTYSCVIKVTANRTTKRVYVVLVVATGGDDDGESDDDASVLPFNFDPGAKSMADATWLDGYGVPVQTKKDPTSQGLVIRRNPSAPKTAIAGVALKGAAGSQLSQLSFDMRSDSECSTRAPQFVIVTADEIVHKASCASGTIQALSVSGWRRVTIDPANPGQLSPAVEPGMAMKTIALVMDSPIGTGMAVLDNINVNGRYVGRQ
jgi:Immunoglobulin domain/Immunoglobulin I-set domain